MESKGTFHLWQNILLVLWIGESLYLALQIGEVQVLIHEQAEVN